MLKDKKIDIVYLWVDGSNPEFREEKKYWQAMLGIPNNDDNAEARFVDNEELRYSLRSVAKNAPWINKIYIVTNGQIPSWLDLSKTDKIKIIKHEDIIPAKYLPCFNSRVIESFVTNIPDLSEYFILSNDDCFINRPLTPSFFLDKNDLPIARLFEYDYTDEAVEKSLYKKSILHSINLIQQRFGKDIKYVPHHNMDMYSKKIFNECLEEFKDEFEKLRNQKFRELSVQRIIFLLYQIVKYKTTIVLEQDNTASDIRLNSLYVDIKAPDKLQHQILSAHPYLLCVNDEPDIEPNYREYLKYQLQIMYPNVQCWEKSKPQFDLKKLDEYKKMYWKYAKKLWLKHKIENVFSIKNTEIKRQKYKIITVLGIKIKIKCKREENKSE